MATALDIGPIQSGIGLDIGPLQSSSSSIISLTQIDILTLSDSEIIVLNLLIDISDSISLSDAVQLQIPGGPLVFTDSIALVDNVTILLNNFISFNDTLNITDNELEIIVVVISNLSDGLVLSDDITVSPFSVITLSLSESIPFADSFQEFTSNPLNFNDILNFQDLVQLAGLTFYQFIDQLSLDDLVTLLLAPIRNLDNNDTITLSDLVTVQLLSIFLNLTVVISDSLEIGDGIGYTLLEGGLMSFSDAFSFGDSFVFVINSNLIPYLRRYLNDVIGDSNP
jgi:hypothetical protein